MWRSLRRSFFTLGLAVVVPASAAERAGPPFSGPSPWPEIRKERIRTLLPAAMRRAGVDAWLVVCRENDNDPLAAHVGGENAGAPAAFLFTLSKGGVKSVALSPAGEAMALKDMALHDEVVVLERGGSFWEEVAKRVRAADPRKMAVNSSPMTVADGLSHTQRVALEKALGPEFAGRLVPSEELVTEWLSVKLPREVDILREAAALTAALEIEAYRTIVPGKTRDSDVARFLKRRMRELGVEDSWAPDQNPNVNSGPDRGHSHATDRVIQPGDFIQTDFGIKVWGTWCTDVQRFAYVLAPGEKAPRRAALEKWENAKKGSRTALAAMKPGVRGYDVDKAQRDWMKEVRSEWVMWGTGHPVGYWAHDVGPALSGAQRETPPAGASLRVLRPGQTFAFDGFFSWVLPGTAGTEKTTKTISVEEMAVVTERGAEYLIPPQEDLVLIPSAGR
jgi:Xaa-Pro dipeptidase